MTEVNRRAYLRVLATAETGHLNERPERALLGIMRRRLRAYASLVRVFLTPTAIADSSAGFLTASYAVLESRNVDLSELALGVWAGTAVTSVALYWFGMAANDLFDRDKDRRAGVPRPLVTGAVSAIEVTAILFLLAAVALAIGFRLQALAPITAILVLSLLYNAGGKRIPAIGNLLMGGCRAGNLLLGAVTAIGLGPTLDWPELLTAATLLAVYIASVTAVSVLEERSYDPRTLIMAASPCLVFPLLFVALDPGDLWVWLNAILLAGINSNGLKRAVQASRDGHHRQGAALFVQQGLGAIFFVDLGLVLALVPDGACRILASVILVALFAAFLFWKASWFRGVARSRTADEIG